MARHPFGLPWAWEFPFTILKITGSLVVSLFRAGRAPSLRLLTATTLLGCLVIAPHAAAQIPEIAIEQPAAVRAGTVFGWGSNFYGQTDPPPIAAPVKAIATGAQHVAALDEEGRVHAWGDDSDGQTDVPAGLTGVKAIAAAGNQTVALKNNGTVVVWGSNSFGQATVPAGLTGVTAIAAGDTHVVALKADGTLVVWGGDSSNGQKNIPAGLSGVKAIAAGGGHTLALKNDGTVVGWGRKNYGQTIIPTGLTGVRSIAAGAFHSLALKEDGTVVAWGSNIYSQSIVPAGLGGVTAIAAGYDHSYALRSDGSLTGWGSDLSGQATVPAGVGGVRAIAAGFGYSVALKNFPGFGNQLVGTSGAARTFAIRNDGGAVLNITSASVIGADAADFPLDATGLPASLPVANGRTAFTMAFAPTATGLRHATLRVVSNDPDQGTYDIPLEGVGISGTALEQWRQSYFGLLAGVTATGSSADGADANRNGIANLLEYALGGNPIGQTTGTAILPRSVTGSGHPQITFPHPGRTGIMLTVQATDNFGAWTDLARSVNGGSFFIVADGADVSETGSGAARTVTVSDLYPVTDPQHRQRFLRVHAATP